ncbi:glutamate racemase [Helicobacter sp. 12S02232-10]|uniref:glutamate racemase n=1 Tax=Helicobacter sp. 12S02232-10 TaxID=1476197 RepID=UPI000BA5F552|nr:glutamate racemase [Helicobacter sp. 12S02232-10]PAF48771.1 glutamate racemase [Helicobacter sp. 12S02232-10]
MKAGVFDSGVGGLTVLKSILNANMFDEIIYYGDTARVPYGVKDKQTIINFSLEALDFFAPHHIDILIIACNTASAYALEEMKEKSPIPVVGVIEPGIQAVKNKITDKDASILVIATKATISSKMYQDKLHACGYTQIQSLATGLFVPIVEEGIKDGEILEATMRYYFSSVSKPPEAIILGCTHFPLIAPAIDVFFKHKSTLIHSGNAIVDYLQKNYGIAQKQIKKQAKLSFYASSNVSSLKETAQKWLSYL